MAHVIDRWNSVNPETGRKRKTDRHGKGLRWQVEYVNGDGAKRRKSFAYRELADAFCADVKAEQHRGVYRRGTGRETFRDVSEQWLGAQLHWRDSTRRSTLSRLRQVIYPSLGPLPVANMTHMDVQNAVAVWAVDRSPAYVHAAFGNVASILKYAHAQQLIPRNPATGVRLPKKDTTPVRPIADETLDAILDAIDSQAHRLVLVAAATGLRSGELRGLTWDRITESTLTVDRQLQPWGQAFGPLKTPSAVRQVSIGPYIHGVLEEQRAAHGQGSQGLVFTSRGGAVSAKRMVAWWDRMRREVPEAGKGWHQLRHYHASRLIAAGMSPTAVAHRLGHRDATETLQVYAHLWADDDDRMRDAGEMIARRREPDNVIMLRQA